MSDAGPSVRRSWWAAWAATTATYVYFLIFAEFALLELATRSGLTLERMQPLLAALGGGGVLGAVAAARLFRVERSRALLRGAFAACGAAALAALGARGAASWTVVFAAVGLSLGALTVTLAAMLRRAVGGVRLGLCVGAGTGVAYALCNLPVVFQANPRVQTGVAALAALSGVAVASRMAVADVPAQAGADDFSRTTIVRWVGALLALVWMDSAVFFVIQHTAGLRAATWEGAAVLVANAGVHLAAGVVSGVVLDAGWRRAPAVAGIGLLGVASLMLGGWLPAVAPAGWLYVAGVSLYSVVLVYVPASSGRAGVAAWIYAVAGWIGSALGIGMAQDLHGVPAWFVAVGVGAVVLALSGVRADRRLTALAAVLVLGTATPGEAADDLIARGREVYVSEGCIHCHSQWLRPRVIADVERWGPATVPARALAEKPPLPGNRRQGPDLANVGNRRSAEWNRLHLQEPRSVSPGSRMPSYAYLFRGVDSEGEALVAYLASLGLETMGERLVQVQAWRPLPEPVIDAARAQRLFAQLCSNCHGAEGRGDGALAARLGVKPPNWRADGWRWVKPGADVELELGRIIKFGLPGSPMAGHEYLPDGEIVGLARHVRLWQRE